MLHRILHLMCLVTCAVLLITAARAQSLEDRLIGSSGDLEMARCQGGFFHVSCEGDDVAIIYGSEHPIGVDENGRIP